MEEKTEEVSPIFIALIYTLMVSKLDSIKIEPWIQRKLKEIAIWIPP